MHSLLSDLTSNTSRSEMPAELGVKIPSSIEIPCAVYLCVYERIQAADSTAPDNESIGMQVVDIADFEIEEHGYTHAYGVRSVVRRPGPSLLVALCEFGI